MAIRHSFDQEVNQVLFEGNRWVKKVILNRPEKLNILNYHMLGRRAGNHPELLKVPQLIIPAQQPRISQMTTELKAYENDPKVKFVVLKGNGIAFCAGGDVVASYYSMVAGHWSFGANFYKKQLILDHLVATYKKPVVALIDGIVMGGGAGLSMNARFKIVTENTVFSMPEAALGHFADVGASYFLSRLPGYLGEYLSLTGARLMGQEMVACGLASHFVHSKDLHLLESALCEVTSSDSFTISERIEAFAQKPKVKEDSAFKRLPIINKCFSKETVEEILSSLKIEAENGAEKWILRAIKSMKSASPLSLKLCLRSIREGRMQGLEECLIREYTTFCHIKRRTASSDFYEGVRAMLLDKDKSPKWEPSKLELVSDEMVDRYFSRVDEDDWEFLQLPSRSNVFDAIRPKL